MRTRMLEVMLGSMLAILMTMGVGHAALTDGLVAYYPFNGDAFDESGNGNNGTVYGATPTTDRHGNPSSAYHFDGIDDYIYVPHSPSLNLTTGTAAPAGSLAA